jgi:hypothetical protein
MRYAKSITNYFITRWEHVRECWDHVRHHWAVEVLITILGIYALYTEYGVLLRIPNWARPESWPKMPISWFLAVLFFVLLLVVVEGSYRIHGTYSTDPYRKKVIALGRDLFAFLKEKGPAPDDPVNHLRENDTKWYAMQEAYGNYTTAIHYGYQHRFKERTIDLFVELAARNIQFDLSQADIDPPSNWVGDPKVKKIAEECFRVVSRMDIEEASKGI